ncbi:MAG TPA: thiol peroxidase [Thermodesulfobacteriota bacterium]|nr:thiol peroxidase [Thermodesulfobacteriota bacterium]
MERKGAVTFKGKPLTLLGTEVKVGDRAPDFKVLDKALNVVGLKDFAGKTKLVSVTPSLDTPVCDQQARRFNETAANLPEDIVVLNVSMDLPFAIGRFCTMAGIEKVRTLSDHRDASFGMAYGVLIKELRLLARSIFVIGKDDRIKYVELVGEVTAQVDFEKALAEAG